MPEDINGIPYMGWYACAVISGRVVERHDLGTHTLFIAEVVDAKTLSDKAPLTYADYQAHVKPKPEQKKEDKKIIGWRCKICNYVYEGSNLPEEFTCPLCGHGADDFEPIFQKEGVYDLSLSHALPFPNFLFSDIPFLKYHQFINIFHIFLIKSCKSFHCTSIYISITAGMCQLFNIFFFGSKLCKILWHPNRN